MQHLRRLLLAGAATLAALAGCGGGASINAGHVRLVNATSEFSSLDLFESSNKLTSGTASYSAGSYADLDHDTYTFNVNANGATAATVSGEVDKNSSYTVVAYTSGGTLMASYLSDNEGDPDSGTAKLRFFNTDSADVGGVDAYLIASACANLSTTAAAAVASGVTALQSTYTQVTASGSGTTYHLCVTATGDKTDLRLDVPAFKLSEKQVVTVILTRSSGGVLLNGLSLVQQGALTQALNSSARLRLAVGTSGGATVTASSGGVALGTALPSGAVGSYKVVTAGAQTLSVNVGGTVVAATGISAPAGGDMTLLVTGTATNAAVAGIADDNSVSTSTTRPVKIRLVNGMTGTGTAVLTDDFNNVGDGAAFGSASAYAQVAASSALARLEATGASQLCLSTDVTLNAGSVYTVFLLGTIPTTTPTCTLRVDR